MKKQKFPKKRHFEFEIPEGARLTSLGDWPKDYNSGCVFETYDQAAPPPAESREGEDADRP